MFLKFVLIFTIFFNIFFSLNADEKESIIEKLSGINNFTFSFEQITSDKVDILRKADTIYIDEIKKAGLYNEIWQAFAVLLPVQTVGVMGDERTYEYVCALRAVTSLDGMTADYYPYEQSFLANVSTRIINEVKGINRVVYDITSKPPGTIEWE